MARQLTRREFLGAALVAGGTVLALATRGNGRPQIALAEQEEGILKKQEEARNKHDELSLRTAMPDDKPSFLDQVSGFFKGRKSSCKLELRHPKKGTSRGGGWFSNPEGRPGTYCKDHSGGWFKYVSRCDDFGNCYEEEWGDQTWPQTQNCRCQ